MANNVNFGIFTFGYNPQTSIKVNEENSKRIWDYEAAV